MGQRWMHPQLSSRANKSIRQGGWFLCCWSVGLGAGLWLVLLLSSFSLTDTALPPRLHSPDAGADFMAVVEPLRTPRGTAHSFEARVEHAALERILAWVHAVLAGTVGVAWFWPL